MRFYAGTPLVTSSGLPIGSVFIIDSRPRAPLSRPQVDFLGVMARNVMEYLEMKRGSVGFAFRFLSAVTCSWNFLSRANADSPPLS